MKGDGGIKILTGADRATANSLFNGLADHGVFVVRRGELEHWLPTLSVTGKGTIWAIKMLNRLGSNSNSESYVRPGRGDVWRFMSDVTAWVKDSSRAGIPK